MDGSWSMTPRHQDMLHATQHAAEVDRRERAERRRGTDAKPSWPKRAGAGVRLEEALSVLRGHDRPRVRMRTQL
jgi:hypothetical protein